MSGFSSSTQACSSPLTPSPPSLSVEGLWGVPQLGQFLSRFCRNSSLPLLRLEKVIAATTPQLQSKPALWPCTKPRGRCCPAPDPHSAAVGDFILTPRREHLPTLHLERTACPHQVLRTDHQRQTGPGHW